MNQSARPLFQIIVLILSLAASATLRADEIEAEIRRVGLADYFGGIFNAKGPASSFITTEAKMQMTQKIEDLRGKEIKNLEVVTLQPLSSLKVVIVAAEYSDHTATIAHLALASHQPKDNLIALTIQPIPDGLQGVFGNYYDLLPDAKLPPEFTTELAEAIKASILKQDFGLISGFATKQAKAFDHIPPYLETRVQNICDPNQRGMNVIFQSIEIDPNVAMVSSKSLTKDLQAVYFSTHSSLGPAVFPVFVLTHGTRHLIIGFGFEIGTNAFPFLNDLRRLESSTGNK